MLLTSNSDPRAIFLFISSFLFLFLEHMPALQPDGTEKLHETRLTLRTAPPRGSFAHITETHMGLGFTKLAINHLPARISAAPQIVDTGGTAPN
jgi:hypothetical protein